MESKDRLSREEFLSKENGNYKLEFWEIVNELFGCDSETDIANRGFSSEDFDNMYFYYLERFRNEDKITLSGEQAKKFINAFEMGDAFGFDTLWRILKEELKIKDSDKKFTIYDLLHSVINVNGMYVWGTQDTEGLADLGSEIEFLYDKLKDKLFNSFTNNFNVYWN